MSVQTADPVSLVPVESAPVDCCGIRIYTRAPLTLQWLRDGILPLVSDLYAHGFPQIWLRRGWLHGPHVDIFAHQGFGQKSPWEAVRAQISLPASEVDQHLSPAQYLAQAREFGRLEAVPAPYLPFANHGASRFLTPAEQFPGTDSLGQLAERGPVLAALCRPLVAAIRQLSNQPEQGPVRLAESFLALADSYFLGLAHGCFSFRSHAEAFFAWSGPQRPLRAIFRERLTQQAAQLRPLVEQRLADTVSPPAAQWRVAFGYSAGALDAAVARGGLSSAMIDAVLAEVDGGNSGSRPTTAFHDTVAAAGILDAPPPWFAAYRVLINLFYQQLPLLTVSAMQRYYMCYAIAELVDEVLGESWQERLARTDVMRVNSSGSVRR